MDTLREGLLVCGVQAMSFKQRKRIIWNEKALQAHQSRVRDQAASMTLLLQAIQLTGPRARQKLLQASEQQSQKSDESPYSIVPSRISMCTSNLSDDGRLVADEEDLVYRPLSFENELFTALVYKRNHRWQVIQKVSHFMRRPSSKAMAQKTATRNDSKDPLVGAESMISQGQDTVNGEIISVDVGSTEGHAVGQTDINDRESSDSVPLDCEYLMPSMCYIFCGQGDHKTVEHLSEDGHDVHARNAMFHEPHESMSAMQRNGELGRTMMRCGVDIEYASFPHGIQPIHRAAACGSMNVIKVLLHHGATVDAIDVDGRQPLHYASQSQCCDQPDVIDFLCSQGANIDANCSKGLVSSPVNFASAQNRVENLKALLALGAKFDDDHCGSVVSALNTATRFRAFATASLLLEHGADPNRRDEIGRLAVDALFAEYHGEGLVENPSLYERVSMLDLLTKHGSELGTQDSKGNTPLHYLVHHRPLSTEESQAQLRLAQKLLDCVDSTDTVDHDGLTTLYFSLKIPEQKEISLLLIEVGARVLIGKADYQLALHIEPVAGSAVLRYSLRHSRGSTREIWEIGMYSQPQHHMALPCFKDLTDREDFPGAFGKDSIHTIGTILTEALHIVP